MRKRLALLTLTALSVADALSGSAYGFMGSAPLNPGAPAGAGCPGADLTCKAAASGNSTARANLAKSHSTAPSNTRRATLH
jgi:hypothetical protein